MQNLHEQINAPAILTHAEALRYLLGIDRLVKRGIYNAHIASKRTVAQDKRRAAKARAKGRK